MKTNNVNLSERVKNGRNGAQYTYLLECIKNSSRVMEEGMEIKSDREAIELFFNAFEEQWNCESEKRRCPNLQERIAEWLQGLPDVCSGIDYWHDEMIALGIKWGVLKERGGRKAEKFKENFYKVIAARALQAGDKLGLDPFRYA